MSSNGTIAGRFEEGIKKYNDHDFFTAHDILEDIWFEIRGRQRSFYQGLIHLAVGFYHITLRKNIRGSLSQLRKGIDKLSEYRPEFQGVELDDLIIQVESCVRIISELNNAEEFDVKKIPKISYKRET